MITPHAHITESLPPRRQPGMLPSRSSLLPHSTLRIEKSFRGGKQLTRVHIKSLSLRVPVYFASKPKCYTGFCTPRRTIIDAKKTERGTRIGCHRNWDRTNTTVRWPYSEDVRQQPGSCGVWVQNCDDHWKVLTLDYFSGSECVLNYF